MTYFKRLLCAILGHDWTLAAEGTTILRFCERCGEVIIETES